VKGEYITWGVRIRKAHFYVVDPARRSQFRQFVNTAEQQPQSEIITERGQHRPADWPKSYPPVQLASDQFKTAKEDWTWVTVANKSDLVTTDAGATGVAVKYGDTQLAIYHAPPTGLLCHPANVRTLFSLN
jgi:nitrite reductase (NAD(P)H)